MFKLNFLQKIKFMKINNTCGTDVWVTGVYSLPVISPDTGQYFGHNVYGYVGEKKYSTILGTYDKKGAEQIVREIERLKPDTYTMPDEIEDEDIIQLFGGDVLA
ncbi:MAG: hypothetical protein M0R06_09335 [Sphaerochaeta sp.]|jgi:hypothetical protein|nr:hypothetical protein [Sphaerochaeta sp.]